MIQLEGEEFLTVEEAAHMLGVKQSTLYAYVSRGRLRSYRRGMKRQRLYRRAEIEALMRLAPSRPPLERRTRAGAEASPVPQAESWIRD